MTIRLGKSQGGVGEIRFRAIEVLIGLIRLSRGDILMLKGGMAVCLIANRRDGLSMNIVLKVGLLGFACDYFRVYFRASSLRRSSNGGS